MTVRIKDLTPAQQRLWRVARDYARAELNYAEEHYAYRSIGDPSDMPHAERKRERAVSRLYLAIKNTPV
jgi:hypothetical protein